MDQGIKIDLNNNIMEYKNMEVPLSIGYNSTHSSKQVILEGSELIPPKSEAVVWAKINGDCGTSKLWVVEATQDSTPDILIGKTLAKTEKNGRIPVRVLNDFRSPVKIPGGTILGQCNEVEAIITDSSENDSISRKDLKEEINVWTQGLEDKYKQKASQLIRKYSNIFDKDGNNPGRTNVVKHCIDTGGARPIRQAPRSVPLAKRDTVGQIIKEMSESGVIEPSASPWSSPVVLVKKKDGQLRFCVDYRRLNDVTKKDSYPLPRIDDTLDSLTGTEWFSTLDLKSGYWQVEMSEEDKEKTAFSVGNGLWQFTVMPFGLCNAPATFERLMDHVLKGLHWKTCLVYLDDIIVLGKSFDEHLRNLEEVFQRVAGAGLKLSPKKCSLFKKEVNYLGHQVTTKGVCTAKEKIEAVKDWPRPRNLHELRSFLGLCTYYRRFVPNFASVAHSLHELTRKNRSFEWKTEQEEAFQALKKRLCTAPMLAYPVPGAKFILDTDASGYGIGGVLSQEIDGQEKVVAYYSRSIGKPERNYCVTRRELLALVDCIKHFHKYLYGQHFRVRTDHAALKWLLQFKNPEGQLARWIERLQSYDFAIEHRKGNTHGNADAMSRRPCSIECKHCSKAEGKEDIIDVRLMKVTQAEEWEASNLRKCQQEDPDLELVMHGLEVNRRPSKEQMAAESPIAKAYWAQWNSLELISGCLHRVWENEDGQCSRKLIVVPKLRIPDVLKEFHNGPSGGHLGITKTLEKIKQRFYWVGCRQSVAEWIANCTECIAAKGPKSRSHGQMKQYNAGAPFERVAMDVAGPFPMSKQGNKYVLVVMDYFSKWPEVYPIPNQEAKTVADAFTNNWVTRYGAPIELHSDQGRNFESAVFQEMCQILGIRKTRTTALHPQSDGMVERFNRTLEEHLRKVVDKHQDDWDVHIPLFLMGYRSAVHVTTGQTPARILFGSELRLPSDLKFGITGDARRIGKVTSTDLEEELREVHALVRQRTQVMSDKMKARYDKAMNSEGFQNGDLVLLYNPQRKRGLSPKLQCNWEGPYKVIKRLNDVVYRIQTVGSTRNKMKVVHLERLAEFGTANVSDRDDQT
uniref:RNA-directed DNA polymerase n=1 Tax=Ceratitis capitata TaxID=7213 RepID=W8B595_CERCA